MDDPSEGQRRRRQLALVDAHMAETANKKKLALEASSSDSGFSSSAEEESS